MKNRIFILTAILIAGFLIAPARADKVKITGVEIERHKYYDIFQVKTTGFIEPRPLKLPGRLVLDFKGAVIDHPQKIAVKKSSRVQAVRIGQFSADPPIVRVVFDLKREIKYDLAPIYGKNRVWLEVADDQGKMPSVAYEPEPKVKPPLTVKVKSKKLAAAKESTEEITRATLEATAHKPVKKIACLPVGTAKKLPLYGRIIVVDPGHGGDDPGARGPGKTPEKEINLKTALYLADYLNSKGATVFLTRKSDVKKRLEDIVNFVNGKRADVYVGVHFNSIDNPSVSGTETHYYTVKSLNLAEAVHKSLLKGIRRPDRGIKQTMLYTIHHADMPAIIVEPIYMTHFQDGLLIKSKSFQKEVARDIARGIVEFLNVN